MRRIAALALLVAAVGSRAADSHLPLSDARWLKPGPGRLEALTMAPPECYRAPADPLRRNAAEAGRIAFRTPLLLGGQAAKSGLSCHSCHVNGHDNPQFFLHGLSAAPGTVDVTSDLFSKTRGDGRFNPVPIPSLVERVSLRQQQGAAGQAALQQFVHGVIVEEFQGAPPPPVVFAALLSYVSSLDASACASQTPKPSRFAEDWRTIQRGAAVLADALSRDDQALADFLLIALRSLLGRINERFDVASLDTPQARLLALSRELGRIRELIPASPTRAGTALAAWQLELQSSGAMLATYEQRSLYNRATLQSEGEK